MAEEGPPRKKVDFFIINKTPKPIYNVAFKTLQFYKHVRGIIQYPVAIYCYPSVQLHLSQPDEPTEFVIKFILPDLIAKIIKENVTSIELQIRFGRQVEDNIELSEGLPGPIQISLNSHKSIAIKSPINLNCSDHLYLSRVDIENEKDNQIKILWPPCKHPYYMVVNIVESVRVEDLVKRVQFQNKLGGMTLNTKAKTMETLKNYKKKSDVLMFGSLKLNLMCPINKLKMILPTRSLKCSSHLQCFDLHTFFSLNKIKPTWKCPICNIPILINELVIDSFLLDIINSSSLPENCFEVIFYANGNWEPYIEPKKEFLEDDQSQSDNEYSENITMADDMDEF